MNRRTTAEHNALASVLDAMPPARVSPVFPALPDDDDQAAPAAPAAPAWPMPTIGGTAPPDLQADVLPGVVGEYVGKHCDSLQVPATMGVGMALSVLAVCAQRRYTVEVHEG